MIELPVIGQIEEAQLDARLAALSEASRPDQKRVWIQTLGCQMNEHDSERIIGMLGPLGYSVTSDPVAADLILYNTCCVRENPERKVYGQVHMLRQLKARKPGLKIGICGCMTQQKAELRRMEQELEHVDLIFGTHNLHRLPELLHQVEMTGERAIEVWHEEGDVVEGLPVQREGNLKAYVTIIYGCNEFCTYCIVPYVRGKERSRRPEQIVAEVERLAGEGYKEVMLLGQNVNAYASDLRAAGGAQEVDFADLLRMVNSVGGIERVRYTSPHPKHFTDRVIDAMAECAKVCEHVHMPAQAGADSTLRRMGRRYTRAHYLDIVRKMRERIPDLAITTDLIVGFPGETEAEFAETVSLIREVEFDSSFMFIYSPRVGTAATRLKEQIPEDVKRERIHRLIATQNEVSLKRNREQIGRRLDVLVEGAAKNDPQQVAGRSRSNKLVVFPGDAAQLTGRTVPVTITGAHTWSLEGTQHAG